MKQLSPEQWRVLNYLYQHKLHTVRPKYSHVRTSQDITDGALIDLIARGLVTPRLGGDEIPDHARLLPRVMQTTLASHVRLHLNTAGLHTVLDDPGNQIRYTLAQFSRPTTVTKLFNGNTITLDDLADQQQHGLITTAHNEFGEFDVIWLVVLRSLGVGEFTVALTAKGHQYLPR